MTELKSHQGYYLWHYLPSTPAAAVFCVLFAITTAAHAWRMYKTRAWFCLAFLIGCLFEVIGYAARATAHEKTDALMPYVIQNFFILLPPALFAASIYMTLGRIILSVNGAHLSIIRPSWLTKIFVGGDILSFLVQGGAAGLMVTGNGANTRTGENMIVGGLGIQVLMFGFFGLTAVLFQVKIRRSPTIESFNDDVRWKQYLNMLYVVSALIMIRSIFRVVEFVMGSEGYLLKHEWTLYVFDSVLMFGVTVAFYWRHPGDIVRWTKGDAEHIQLDSITSKP